MESHLNPPSRACDNCRFRKTKCDRKVPCGACSRSFIPCKTAQAQSRNKGARGGNGRRLRQLRLGKTEPDGDPFEVYTPSTFSSSKIGVSDGCNDCLDHSPEPASDPASSISIGSQLNKAASPILSHLPYTSEPLSTVLSAHIEAFVAYIFPIMPVVDTDALLNDSSRLDELSPVRYALVTAVCATTRLQLNLDNATATEGGFATTIPQESGLDSEMLLSFAEYACKQVDFIGDLSVDCVVLSYFMFTVYASLEKLHQAWFYLNQSITLAVSLGLDVESTYQCLKEADRDTGRVCFWILFVTERTFALQHRRPVRLRSSIMKPDVINSQHPVVMNDLLNHISVFEVLPPSLYEWQPQPNFRPPQGIALVKQIDSSLCRIQSISMIESQKFDTLITRQWLRVTMWRLVFGDRLSISSGNGSSKFLPFSTPVDVGRNIMETLCSVHQSSIGCHGIAIEQKLYDIGTSLADSMFSPSTSSSSLEVSPRDLLCAVVKSLTNTRSGKSHLLPKLLEYSEFTLSHGDPTACISVTPEVTSPESCTEQNDATVLGHEV